MSELNQWEYRVKTFGTFFKGVKDDALEAELNQWGEEGWEVAAYRMIENTNQGQVIAKRPLDRTARRWRSMP
ncbi:MAG: hypothetical protein FD146_217 [Anaerolineaceae bacterium]|nr:MAG: hypothetical protein FD146_217 [Anaerolineaceae bacterium]